VKCENDGQLRNRRIADFMKLQPKYNSAQAAKTELHLKFIEFLIVYNTLVRMMDNSD